MVKFGAHCFLFVFCNVICLSLNEAAKDQRQVYIAYMGAIPERDNSPYSINLLQQQHTQILHKVCDGSITRNTLVRSYKKSFNGFAAYLTKQQKEKLAGLEGVVSVFPSRTLWPKTTSSWDYMGLHENVNGNTNSGSDIIIGVLDSGIWPDHESFSDQGFGPIPKKWKGACLGGKNFTCNKKLIGARFYTSRTPAPDSAIDTDGHGTHTASTAAGNAVKDASFYGIAGGTARGGAPSARIAAYKVCYSGCKDEDILAAFDDAIADGVDIITISVGPRFSADLKDDSIAIGSLHAMQNGILTVHSAGNEGIFPGQISSVAPWLLTVGASSMDRGIAAKVSLGNGKTIIGKAVNSFKMNGTQFPLVYGKYVTKTCDEQNARNCNSGCLDRSLVSEKIVLCDNIQSIEEALAAGALGVIAETGEAPDVSRVVPLPASVFLKSDQQLAQHYANSTKGAKAFISTSESIKNNNAPVVASFSSKGPNSLVPDILKPDMIAPGVEILAAYSPLGPVSAFTSDKRSVKYSVLSGTSMSCPHVAGAAALVKLAHPDWSPSAIKSALMTTAWPMDPEKHQYAEFEYGAGHLSPVNATNPGLVYETNNEDYIKMLCNMGYPSQTVMGLLKDNSIDCTKLKQAEETSKDLNYPSMTFHLKNNEPTTVSFSRTVTNVGVANSTYTARIDRTLDANITVEPGTLSFKQLNEKKSFVVTVKVNQLISTISDSLVWSDGTHFVRSPIVVYNYV